MKDASSTDVVVHAGRRAHDVLPVRRRVPARPADAGRPGHVQLGRVVPRRSGVSAHPKVDDHTGELLFFNYSTTRRTCTTAWSTPAATWCTTCRSTLPGPRLPHDMAFTEHYAILNDLPVVLGPGPARARRVRGPLPPRPPVPVRGHPAARRHRRDPLVRGRPDLRAALDQRVGGGRRDRPDGFFQGCPERRGRAGGPTADVALPGPRRHADPAHRWRFNLLTGATREKDLSDAYTEFGTINAGSADGPTGTPTLPPTSRAGSCSTGSSSTNADRPRGELPVRTGRVLQRGRRGPARGRHRRRRRVPRDADGRHEP